MRFKKSEGLNASERVLAELCEKSFLRLWTYPNLFMKPTKELTDLLVVFGNDVILFSAKAWTYPNTGNAELDWSRWYRQSIAHSAQQIAKAEKWIRSVPEKVFLDAKCLERLPVTLPNAGDIRVHRICVALGALDRAEAETGTRGLKIKPAAVDSAERFTVGKISKSPGWVHMFDEESLTKLLSELSTITDFIHYLNSRAALFDTATFKFAASEADMLARYLWHNRTFPAMDGEYQIEANLWPQVEASQPFLASREANRVSQFWDGLIEYITNHYLDETLEIGNELTMSDYEKGARILATETRFQRRVLTKLILERRETAKKNAVGSLLPSGQADVSYVLFVGRGDQGKDHEAYRKDRAQELHLRCVAAKDVDPQKRFIVGVAMDASGIKGSSEDFIFFDTAEWTAEQLEKAQQVRADLGYFKEGSAVMTRLSEDEYPKRSTCRDWPMN
jgi:hypothetical protein